MTETILLAVLSGGVGAAIISGITGYILARQQHMYNRSDHETDDIKALKTAMRYIMLDRIRELGGRYINEGSIDFDDRRLLNEMHNSYHNGLGGNGDLDVLMAAINNLPLKTRM